jgi:hypothetical protein
MVSFVVPKACVESVLFYRRDKDAISDGYALRWSYKPRHFRRCGGCGGQGTNN